MIDDYEAWIFDGDGVLLDLNREKTEAFRVLGNDYGPRIGDVFVAYHVEHGGVSRFVKVNYLFRELLGPAPATSSSSA